MGQNIRPKTGITNEGLAAAAQEYKVTEDRAYRFRRLAAGNAPISNPTKERVGQTAIEFLTARVREADEATADIPALGLSALFRRADKEIEK